MKVQSLIRPASKARRRLGAHAKTGVSISVGRGRDVYDSEKEKTDHIAALVTLYFTKEFCLEHSFRLGQHFDIGNDHLEKCLGIRKSDSGDGRVLIEYKSGGTDRGFKLTWNPCKGDPYFEQTLTVHAKPLDWKPEDGWIKFYPIGQATPDWPRVDSHLAPVSQ